MADRRGTLEDLGKLIQENGIHMTEWTKEMWQEFCTFYKGKKVLVTGHTGFKGSWLVRMLEEAGAAVTLWSRRQTPASFTSQGFITPWIR